MFPPEIKAGKRRSNKRITGADYIKPDELLVNIRTANKQWDGKLR
jgi:hypothetical protein